MAAKHLYGEDRVDRADQSTYPAANGTARQSSHQTHQSFASPPIEDFTELPDLLAVSTRSRIADIRNRLYGHRSCTRHGAIHPVVAALRAQRTLFIEVPCDRVQAVRHEHR